MWLTVVLAAWFATRADAFAHSPIVWKGLAAKRFVLAPRVLTNRFLASTKSIAPLQTMAIWEQPVRRSPSEIPYFTPRLDGSIALDATGLCLEADGDRSGDAVRINHCNGGTNQLWSVTALDGGRLQQIKLKGTENCIDVFEGLNASPVELRRCDGRVSELWKFEEPIPLPVQAQPTSRKFPLPSCVRLAMISLSSIVLLGMSGFIARLLRFRGQAHVAAARQSSMPLNVDQHGVSLIEHLVMQKDCRPASASLGRHVQQNVPTAMVLAVEEGGCEEDPEKLDVESEPEDRQEGFTAVPIVESVIEADRVEKEKVVVWKAAKRMVMWAPKRIKRMVSWKRKLPKLRAGRQKPMKVSRGSRRGAKFLASAAAGGFAACMATIVFHPVDTLKTILQRSGDRAVLSSIGVGSLYRGVVPGALAVIPGCALRMGVYEVLKSALLQAAVLQSFPQSFLVFLASASGTVASCIVRAPLDMVKTRVQADPNINAFEAMRDAWGNGGLEGLSGVYRGVDMALARDVPFFGINLLLYEKLKRVILARRKRSGASGSSSEDDKLSSFDVLLVGFAAQGLAGFLTNPADFLKTQVQAGAATSMRAALRAALEEGGPSQLMAGAGMRAVWLAPQGCVYYPLYEKALRLLSGASGTEEDNTSSRASSTAKDAQGDTASSSASSHMPKSTEDALG